MCIAVSSSPAVCSFFILLAVKRSLTVLRYHLFVLSCLKRVNTIIMCNTKHSKLLKKIKVNILFESSDITVYDNLHYSGLLIFRGKKSKISRDFQGQIRGKIGRFRGIFAGRKVKSRRKIGRFRGILAEKSQISKDFRGKFLEKSADLTGNFGGETSPRNNQ